MQLAGLFPHEGPHGGPGPVSVVEALISKNLPDEVLVSWHDFICLGVLSSTFPAGRGPTEAGGVGGRPAGGTARRFSRRAQQLFDQGHEVEKGPDEYPL